jgi:hypothetical protein
MSWPERIRFAEAPGIVGGHMNDAFDPDCELVLETVDVRDVYAGEGADWKLQSASGESWNRFHVEEPEEDDEGNPIPASFDYALLEAAMRAGEPIAPLVLERNAEGRLLFVDGWHRMTIALYVGRYHLPAYVRQARSDDAS